MNNNKRGFSLIELVIVIAIIAILIGIAAPKAITYINTTNEEALNAQMEMVFQCASSYDNALPRTKVNRTYFTNEMLDPYLDDNYRIIPAVEGETMVPPTKQGDFNAKVYRHYHSNSTAYDALGLDSTSTDTVFEIIGYNDKTKTEVTKYYKY